MIEVVDMTQVQVGESTWHGIDADSANRKSTLCGLELGPGVRAHWDLGVVRCVKCRARMLLAVMKVKGGVQ